MYNYSQQLFRQIKLKNDTNLSNKVKGEIDMKKNLVKMLKMMLTATLALGMLAGCGSKESNTIVMGTNAEFEPFEYREGDKVVGFDVEIAKLFAEKMGKELKIEDMAFDTLTLAVESGKIDFIAAGMSVTEERKTQVDFSDPYFTSKQMIIVSSDNTDITSNEDLVGKKIGVQLGTTGDLFASDIEDAEIVAFDKGSMAILDLKNKKVDAVIIDAEPAKRFVAGQDDLKILDTPFVEEEYAIAVKKGNTKLVEELNAFLKEIKENGQYDEIFNKYFAESN